MQMRRPRERLTLFLKISEGELLPDCDQFSKKKNPPKREFQLKSYWITIKARKVAVGIRQAQQFRKGFIDRYFILKKRKPDRRPIF